MSQDTGVLMALICVGIPLAGCLTFAAWIAVCELVRHWRTVGAWLLIAAVIAVLLTAAAFID
ncbi:hypothetical protein ACFV3E_24705 [Streptomyces sp. NPDC059718]